MRHKFYTVILIFTFSVSNLIAQNIFSLKGKNIILTSDKIAYGTAGTTTQQIAPSYSDAFGIIYTQESLIKNKFTKKYLCKDTLVGKKVHVSDVYMINPNKKKKKAVIMCLNTDSNVYVIHLPLCLEGHNYYSSIDVKTENICLFYYDYDEIVEANNRYCSKKSFHKVKEGGHYKYLGNEPSVIDSFKFKDNNLYAYYKNKMNESGIFIAPYNTGEFHSYYYYEKLDEFLSEIILEEDLIDECKKRYDSVYIDSIKRTFLNKEVYYSQENYVAEENKFNLCTNIEIKNTGRKEPNYQFVITLTNNNGSKDIIITKDNMKFIELAEEYREKKKIKEEKEEQERITHEALLAKEEAEYKAKLIHKYGKQNALLILNNEVKLGFTKAMCIEAWGKPSEINRTITRYGTREQWVYGLGCYLYFDGNILSGIQD